MSSAPLASGEMTLSAPDLYSLLIFSRLLALATIHIFGWISLAVKVINKLSTSSPVVIMTPLALFIPESINKLNVVDLVICSRFLNGPPQKMPIGRKLSNKLTTSLLRYTSGYHVTDSQCGFRTFSDKAARVFLDIPYDDYEFESEMLYQASLNSLTLIELAIPSSYQGEKSYITSFKIIKYIYYILKLLLRDLKRRLKY